MRNNKGFTLMELLAAIFIGGMVTAAMILIWKVASIQTGQGQRQTIVRNQISNFERQLYKDFQEADIITFPNDSIMTGNTTSSGLILAGLKHVMPYERGSFYVLPGNTAEFFAYCIDVGEGTPNVIKKSTGTIAYDSNSNNIYSLADYSFSSTSPTLSSNCLTNGKSILSDFTLTNVNLNSNGIYTLAGNYIKKFTNGRETTPIKIEVKNKFYNHGGFYYAQ